MSKRLLLCRHAKSSWKDPSLTDIARPLNRRGKQDAPLMGAWLHHQGIMVDAILASPAKRARSTARKLARAIGFDRTGIITLDVLYFGSGEEILLSLHHLPDPCEQVLVVGHNPTITDLANRLGNLCIDNVPTCGIVGLEFETASWEELALRPGKPLFFEYPKHVRRDFPEDRIRPA